MARRGRGRATVVCVVRTASVTCRTGVVSSTGVILGTGVVCATGDNSPTSVISATAVIFVAILCSMMQKTFDLFMAFIETRPGANNNGQKKRLQNVCMHIDSKRIDLVGPGWLGMVRF